MMNTLTLVQVRQLRLGQQELVRLGNGQQELAHF